MALRSLVLALSAVVSAAALAQTGALRTVDPSISPDGKTIIFSWQGDLWSVPSTGGDARRLTIHPAEETFPVWAPDGQSIVFSSNRFGNNDLFSMRPDGTGLRRLTYESSSEAPNAIGPDGTIYGYTGAWGRADLFMVKPTGGDIVRLSGHALELEFSIDLSPDGRTVVFNSGGSPGNWRKPGYKGSNSPDVWVGTMGVPVTGMRNLTRNDALDMFPRFVDANTVVMVSNREGKHDIWRMDVRNGRAERLTNFPGGTIRMLTVARGAQVAAFQRNSRIYTLDLRTRAVNEVVIRTPEDSRRNAELELTLTSGISDMAVSPDGKRMIAGARGELFLLPGTGGTTRRVTTNPGPDGQPQWIDDKTVLYTAAKPDGKRTLRTMTITGEDTLWREDPQDVMGALISPDRKWVAFHRGDREIVVAPIDGKGGSVVATGDFATGYNGGHSFSWSPDSQWLVLTRSLTRSVTIEVVKRDGSERMEITKVGKSASTPVFTADGRHLAFIGVEGLDYNESRGGGVPLMIIDLQAAPIRFSEDDLDKLDEAPAARGDGAVTVSIDKEGLATRRRRVMGSASGEGVTGYWPAAQGGTIYANVGGQFSTISAATGSVTPVAGVTGPVSDVLATRNRVYINQAGRISILNPQGAPVPVAFSATYRINHRDEERALFNEAWWALDRMFYDPAMHGRNWAAIRSEFAEIVPHVTSRDDFYALMSEMVERLDSSHQGATSSDPYRSDATESTAWLGTEWDWAQLAQGRVVVDKVYADTPAAHPQSRLRKGDRIVSINGVAPSADKPVAELLRGQSGRRVRLQVQRGSETMTMDIRPTSIAARSGVAYDDWVAWTRKEVDRLSNGRLAYIHIQGMDAPSLGVFLREIATEAEGKEGVLLDVRYNGGGFTSHIILNILRKTPWLIRTGRDLPGVKISENIFRGNSLELPVAGLTNQYSFSNAEIFSEGMRFMKIGPVIGEPTAGGVIGTGSYGLWDGGAIRMPGSGAYAVNGENLENNGRKPDILVPFDPVLWQQGRDAQLERAVAELLRRL